MPYIRPERRIELDAVLGPIKYHISNNPKPGELNYIITSLVQSYYAVWSRGYADFNDILGILECAKFEFYRKVIAPYEEKKCRENGDVYPLSGATDTTASNKDEEL